MIVFCEECGEQYNISSDDIKKTGCSFRCKFCNDTITVSSPSDLSVSQMQKGIEHSSKWKEALKKDPIKLLIVDDSKLIRRALCKIFDSNDDVKVIGEAGNGLEALEVFPRLNPDVVTMDINMPAMDGLTALKHIMIKHPKPTVMLSTLTQEGAAVTFDSLKYGAVDFIPKPSKIHELDVEVQHQNIIRKIILAAGVEMEAIRYLKTPSKVKNLQRCEQMTSDFIVAIGTSEGGYGALLKVIPRLLPGLPTAIIAVLYEDPRHIDAFARYLDDQSLLKVKRAKDGEPIQGGVCYLASGDEYTIVESMNGGYLFQVNRSPFPTRRGAINMLMFSVAEVMKNRTAGVILSGTGEDGVEGINEIIRMGGTGIVQDPTSCLYKETSRLAIDRCKVDLVLPAGKIAEKMNHFSAGKLNEESI
jgi:two-component system chemotaxis response regulator CheB